MITTTIPTCDDLRAAPELAALALVDAAVTAAEEALLAYHPAVADLGGAFQGRAPPLSCAVASILVARFNELHDLLAWYRLAVKSPQSDDFPF